MIGVTLLFLFISSQALCDELDIKALHDSCSYQCLDYKFGALLTNSTNLTRHEQQEEKNALSVCHWYDIEKLQEICKYIDKDSVARRCIDYCEDNKYKIMVEGVIKDTLCGEDEIKNFTEHFPCISKNCDDVDKICQSKCHNATDVDLDIIIRLKHNPHVELDKNKTKQSLGNACRYLSCHNQCANSIYAQKCDNNAAIVIDQIILSSVRLANDILTITGRKDLIAPECHDLIKAIEEITPR